MVKKEYVNAAHFYTLWFQYGNMALYFLIKMKATLGAVQA